MIEMKDIPGFEGKYAVTRDGQVWSYKSNKFLLPSNDGRGYLTVWVGRTIRIHRLVAETYIPNPNNYETVDHINCNRSDNRVENLRWMTREENISRARRKQIYCVELNKVFPSQKAAANELGLDQGNISKVCRGICNKTGGYHFRFVEQEKEGSDD